MNKQEAIEQINYMDTLNINDKTACQQVDMVIKNQVLDIINQIGEPQKPKVPQVAVEFYERYKDDNLALGEWFDDFYSPEAIEEFPRMDELTEWLYDNNDEINRQREFALATLVTLGIDAVEVEKGKLYIAKNKQTDEYLCYCFKFFHDKHSSSRFTAEEKRWKELGYWGNDLYVFEEAEGEDE